MVGKSENPFRENPFGRPDYIPYGHVCPTLSELVKVTDDKIKGLEAKNKDLIKANKEMKEIIETMKKTINIVGEKKDEKKSITDKYI